MSRAPESRRPRVLYIVTHPMTARHLLAGQPSFMRRAGFDVAVSCSPGPDLDVVAEREEVRVFPVPIPREIAPFADLRAVWHLAALMRLWKPDVVNAGTPKAGLLGMLAAWAVRVPVRLYTLRGLRMETTSGAKRVILNMTERLASACAHEVIAVSHSLAEQYVGLGLASAEKVRVLGAGASNGVRVERFTYPDDIAGRETLRHRLVIPGGAPVIGFVGRYTRDKGITELVEAFGHVRATVPDARLLLVGDFEEGDPLPEATVMRIRDDPAIVTAGFVPDPAPYYAIMDVIAFPSHREGFPNVPLEAAAAGLPVAGFRATGTVDAVQDGATGMLVDLGDVKGLASILMRYLEDETLRRSHGSAGRARARKEYTPERVWDALLSEYRRLLNISGSLKQDQAQSPGEVPR